MGREADAQRVSCSGRVHISPVMESLPFRDHSCGKELPKTHTKVEKENQNGVGNLCLWGRHIFMGYLRDKQNTENKVDTHGWLHTNDLGFLDFDKFLYIMGKAKGEEYTPRGWPHSLAKGMFVVPISHLVWLFRDKCLSLLLQI